MANDGDNGYPRVLDQEGCLFGQHLTTQLKTVETKVITRLENMETNMKGIKQKLDRMTWALVAASLTLGTAALMLALNLRVITP